jgi:hypothetical protein
MAGVFLWLHVHSGVKKILPHRKNNLTQETSYSERGFAYGCFRYCRLHKKAFSFVEKRRLLQITLVIYFLNVM